MAKIGVLPSGNLLNSVVLVLVLTSACSRGAPPPSAEAPQGVPVRLQTVETTTIEESDSLNSTLEAEKSVALKPEMEGRVTRLFVSSGDRVGIGTPIVQLSPEKRQAQVQGAIANVNAARATRDNEASQIQALEAERVSAVAELELQNQQYKRISTLVSQGAFARQQLDIVERDRKAAQAALNAVNERILAARSSLDRANADLQQAQAALNEANEELKDAKIVAPIVGIVGDIPVKIGDYVDSADTLTTIIQNQTLELRLPIDVGRSAQLRVGLPVKLYTSQGGTFLGTGQISFVSPQVSQSQTILAKASVANANGKLRDGQKVWAEVIWNQRPDSVVVPTTAITYQGEDQFVYVVDTGDKPVARRQSVQVGLQQGDRIEVRQGLQPGQKIVVSGTQKLADGVPIVPLPDEAQGNQQSSTKILN